jgi:hypothetical protein
MRCGCGRRMCYVCGQLLDSEAPYAHFDETGTCELFSAMPVLHEDRAREAGQRAKEDYLRRHPEMSMAASEIEVDDLVGEWRQGESFPVGGEPPFKRGLFWTAFNGIVTAIE